MTTYDRQKVAAEQFLKQAAADGVVRGISLRLPTVFGHGRTPGSAVRGVVGAMARRALDGRPLTMWHDGTVLRDLVLGDTPLDIDCARAFGAIAVAVATGQHSREELAGERPDLLFDSFADVDAAIAALLGR